MCSILNLSGSNRKKNSQCDVSNKQGVTHAGQQKAVL